MNVKLVCMSTSRVVRLAHHMAEVNEEELDMEGAGEPRAAWNH